MSIRERIAVSTWSLHRYLGVSYPHDLTTLAVPEGEQTWGEGEDSLLGVPSALRRHLDIGLVDNLFVPSAQPRPHLSR